MELQVKNEPLNIKEYRNAWVTLDNRNVVHIYDENGSFVMYTSKRLIGKHEYAICDDISEVSSLKGRYVNETVVYIGFLREHYGHFLIDSTVRMWSLFMEQYKNLRMIVSIEGREEFCYSFMNDMGMNRKQLLVIDRTTQFKSILIPEISYFPGHYISNKFLIPFRTVLERVNLDLPCYDKIYFSRVHFSKDTKECGEFRIQQIFEKNGYHIFYPEELRFEEQIWYLKNCKTFVSVNGTIAHNVLFTKDGTRQVILIRFKDGINEHQEAISQVMNIDTKIVNTYAKWSDREVSLMKITRELSNFFRQENMIITKYSRWQALKTRWFFIKGVLVRELRKATRK